MIPSPGLPAGFGQQMFTNMQQANQAQTNAGQQQILDNNRNPAMSGAATSQLNQNNQAGADRAMGNMVQGQLAGAQAGFQGQQAGAQRAQTQTLATQAQQAAMNQLLAQIQAQKELSAQGFQQQSQLQLQGAAENFLAS